MPLPSVTKTVAKFAASPSARNLVLNPVAPVPVASIPTRTVVPSGASSLVLLVRSV